MAVLSSVTVLGITTTHVYHMYTCGRNKRMHVIYSDGFGFGDGFG